MDHLKLKKILLFIGTISFLLLSTTAVPSTRVFEISPSVAPTAQPITSEIQFFGNFLTKAAKEFGPEILNFCTDTENPTLCAETISPYFTGSFDPVMALQTEINATLDKAKEIADSISKMLDDPATAKNAMDALGICKSQYEDMLDTIKEAVDLVSQQNVVDAYYKFSSVISDKSTCDDAFEESPGVDIPFSQDTTALYQLGGNCLAIMDAIVNNHKL